MKKTKFLSLVLVVAIMMMGAGYAYWTQDLTIENNISTGELDVIFADPDYDVDDYMIKEEGSVAIVGNTDNHELNVNLKDAYPGAEIMLSFKLDNEGTLGAHVRDFGIDSNAINTNLVLVRSYKVGDDPIITLTEDTTLATVLSELNNNKGIFVDKDKDVKLVFNLEIDPKADNDSLIQDTENVISFTINAKAYQYNHK